MSEKAFPLYFCLYNPVHCIMEHSGVSWHTNKEYLGADCVSPDIFSQPEPQIAHEFASPDSVSI